jgi:hypothetical protein
MIIFNSDFVAKKKLSQTVYADGPGSKPTPEEVELFVGQHPITMRLSVGDKGKAMELYRRRTNSTLTEATEAFTKAIYSSVCRLPIIL